MIDFYKCPKISNYDVNCKFCQPVSGRTLLVRINGLGDRAAHSVLCKLFNCISQNAYTNVCMYSCGDKRITWRMSSANDDDNICLCSKWIALACGWNLIYGMYSKTLVYNTLHPLQTNNLRWWSVHTKALKKKTSLKRFTYVSLV